MDDEDAPLLEGQNQLERQAAYVICSKAGIMEYLELGIPATAAFSSESWAFQIMTFVAASFGVDYQAAHIVLEAIMGIELYVGFGLSQAALVIVGQ